MVLGRSQASEFGDTLHAVLVGVDRVPGDWLNRLSVAERDARALATALTLPNGCAVPPIQVCALLGADATRDAVLEALQSAAARLGPDSTLIFYFAGHGLAKEGAFWLCTATAAEQSLDGTALGSTDLEAILGACSARGVLVILDCCEGAAFAEAAPTAFTNLRVGEYRLLISASRANQRSWEASDGSGTLFSQALLAILRGEIQVGRIAGAVYFSDFVDAIDAYVAEGLEHRPGLPHQEMMFVGAYVRDPLVLVHRGLSLAQVKFATARYSPAHVRRVLLRSSALVAGFTLFALATAYGLQDQTQFARTENGKISIFRGRLEFNLPGYPKLLWTLSYGPERLKRSNSSGPFELAASLGHPVMPLIEDRLRPDYHLLAVYESGRDAEARSMALAAIADADTPFEQKLNASLLFAKVAKSLDQPILVKWLSGERKELRLAAFLALLRLDAPNPAVSRTLAGEEIAEHEDVVRGVEGPCTPTLTAYLERRFDAESSHPTNAEILDAAVRANCRLSVAALVKAAARPSLFGDRDVAAYARWIGQESGFAALLVRRLQAGDLDMWRAAGLVGTLAELRDATCSPVYRPGLEGQILAARLMSMAAVARHCESPHWTARIDSSGQRFLISAVFNSQEFNLALNLHSDEERLAVRYLIHLPELGLPVAGLEEAVLRLLPSVEDTQLKSELISVLIRARDPHPVSSELLGSNELEVRAKVVELRRLQHDPQLVPQLLARLGAGDDFYVSLAGRMPLREKELDDLRGRLYGSENERRQIACVLAMRDTPDHIVALITSQDWIIREEAIGCAPFNADAPSILKAAPRDAQGFPIEGYATLRDQVQRKIALEQELTALPPDQRLWRLSITDKTPAGFGMWGRGMRDWIDEQTYQLTVAN